MTSRAAGPHGGITRPCSAPRTQVVCKQESIDGVPVARRGRQHTVNWHGYRRYAAHVRGRYDLIVEAYL